MASIREARIPPVEVDPFALAIERECRSLLREFCAAPDLVSSDGAALNRISSNDDTLGMTSRIVSGSLTPSTEADCRRRIMMEAVERLPPQCQAALTLKMLHGLTYRQIGKRLGISAQRVEHHVAHGLFQVHACLSRRQAQMKQ